MTQTRAISGLGGIGKTQTVLEYAYRYGHLYHYVLWVGAATPEALLTDFVKLATLLDVPGRDEQDQQINRSSRPTPPRPNSCGCAPSWLPMASPKSFSLKAPPIWARC